MTDKEIEIAVERLILLMERNAEAAPNLELTPKNWLAEFGENGIVQTPIGEVKMGDNQYLKMGAKNRGAEFGMVKPTLTNPDVIIEEQSRGGAVVNERETNLLFVKTFTDATSEKYTHFENVTVSKDKKEVVVSNHRIRRKQLLDKLQAGCVVYTATALNASGQAFAEYTPHSESGVPVVSTAKIMQDFEKVKEKAKKIKPTSTLQKIVALTEAQGRQNNANNRKNTPKL